MAAELDSSRDRFPNDPAEDTIFPDLIGAVDAQEADAVPSPVIPRGNAMTAKPTVSQGKGKPNIFKRVIGAIREWSALQKNIRATSVSVSKLEWEIQENLNNYRLALSTVSFKSYKADQDIWSAYHQICEQIPDLRQRTRKKPLVFRRRQTLKILNHAWVQLEADQKDLLDTLIKSPKSVEFYNRIHLARIKKREEEVRESEVAQRSARAKEAIEKALAHIGEVDLHPDGPTLGSGILKLDEAKNFWTSRLQEISNLETSSQMDPEEIIHIYSGLESTIQDAPRMAEQVREVEIMFVRMMNMHEELSAYGKNIIPIQDMARMMMTVQEEIPKLWAMGSWEKLRRSLDEVTNFVKFYELPVRSELSLAERRKPGMTRTLLSGAGMLPIGQITPLLRSLVSAIDSRDKYMAGHSDAVARLSVQVAKKMNWSGEDLELLEIAALLHDVGKIIVPENVLTKLDPLSPEDWKSIQMHPYHGAQIVKSIDMLSKISPWILHHQERWDGKGYPNGVSSKDIPPAARIIGVGEAFMAMTTDQPKRKAMSIGDAIAEISRGSGSQFDPESAGALIQSFESGETKLLNPKGG